MHAEGGPWVHTAAICENVIEDTQGVLTLVRIINKVVRTVIGPEPPGQMESFRFQGRMVIGLTAGDIHGVHSVRIDLQGPDGITKKGPLQECEFTQPESRVNVVLTMLFDAQREGWYWFDVVFDDVRILTRIPLKVEYVAQSEPPPPI